MCVDAYGWNMYILDWCAVVHAIYKINVTAKPPQRQRDISPFYHHLLVCIVRRLSDASTVQNLEVR